MIELQESSNICWRLSESGLSAFLAAEVPGNSRNTLALVMNFYEVFRVSSAMSSKFQHCSKHKERVTPCTRQE